MPEIPQEAFLRLFFQITIRGSFEFPEQFFLSRRQVRRRSDEHTDVLIATPIAAKIANPLAFQHEHLTRLCSPRHGEGALTVKGGDLNIRPKRRLGEGDRDFTDDVIILTLEKLVGLYMNEDVQVA